MAREAVRRSFDVPVGVDEAWRRLSEVERWPEWAPHIKRVTLRPPGALGPTSSGTLHLRRLGPTTFRMSVWSPPDRWEWVGGVPGLRIEYDHLFAPAGSDAATLTWVVRLAGPLAPVVRPAFARIYGHNVDRAIPHLHSWLRSQRADSDG